MSLSDCINLCLRRAGLNADEAAIYANFIASRSHPTVHITGKQGTAGKSTLCRELRKYGINAFEDWELEGKEKDNSNAAYIEIVLNERRKSNDP